MDKKSLNHTIAVAVRVEQNFESNELFLVFEVVDEEFKKQIKENWMADIELKIIGRKLVLNKEE